MCMCADAGTLYWSSVAVGGDRGKSVYTIVSHALAAPSVAPQNIQVNTVSSTQLEVQWEPPPVETQNGIIQGYKVITSPPRSLFFF